MQYHPEGQYLTVHQTRDGEPSEYEGLLGDALERAFAAGITEIEGVVSELVNYGIPAPDGKSWNEALLRAELSRLGS